jgi:hemerythrin-like domain-containing protein
MEPQENSRRTFLIGAAGLGTAALVPSCLPRMPRADASKSASAKAGEEGVSPMEDLMREHGLLDRALLVYEECAKRLEGGRDVPPSTVGATALLVRRFIEEYHEKLEEEHIFPRFEKANREAELVATLRSQHSAGRTLTLEIERLAPQGPSGRGSLAPALRAFIAMYRPHAAREDTVLFPAFHELVSPAEYEDLGEEFESKEHALFGAEGFEKCVAEVASLEREVGIYELAAFTPK